jgi:hypothetical protein
MPAIQRFIIVPLSAAYWGVGTLIALMLYGWIARGAGRLQDIVINACLVGLLGAVFGFVCALASYVRPLNGAWYQRAAVGAALGVLCALVLQATEVWMGRLDRQVLASLSNYSIAIPLRAAFGLATTQRVFFAIAQ